MVVELMLLMRISMRSNILPTLVLVLFSSFLWACDADEDESRLEGYRQYLRDHYQGFEPQPISHSDDFGSEEFVFHDLLVADFNHDGIEDFAAELMRTRSPAEASEDEVPARRSILTISSAVVCQGQSEARDLQTRDFDCHYLQDPYPAGGINGDLAFIEVLPENLSDERLSSGEECGIFKRQWQNKRVLSLVSSYGGYCLSLYYPKQGTSNYNECIYCAD